MAAICAVDVGTRSARAGLFGTDGALLGRGEHPILLRELEAGYAEHSSDDIWVAVCKAVEAARQAARLAAGDIAGIAFDATCSLVALDRDGGSLTVALDGDAKWDTIVWLDHRSMEEAAECTAIGDTALAVVGGVMSPEMQTPKAMWLKRHVPDTWSQLGLLFDLPDYLTWRACGSTARSVCTLAPKWPYRAQDEAGWQHDFLARVGLSDLLERGGLPARATPVGSDLGPLTAHAAAQLGLTGKCRVTAGLVDAFAGTLGILGAETLDGTATGSAALIAGTSSCVMANSRDPKIFPGFWGPYFATTLPGHWTYEGGQSATGGLLDHIIRIHGAGGEPTVELHGRIASRVAELRNAEGRSFAGRLHVLPDFHGHRSPLADPAALGVISGLSLDASFDGLCRLYWRACIGIALGVRQILETMAEHSAPVDTLHVTGGHTRNPLLMELYADVTGCRLVVPKVDEAVLLGTAMAAATGAGLFPDLPSACTAMRPEKTVRLPNAAAKPDHDRDYRIFLEMQRHRRTIDAMA